MHSIHLVNQHCYPAWINHITGIPLKLITIPFEHPRYLIEILIVKLSLHQLVSDVFGDCALFKDLCQLVSSVKVQRLYRFDPIVDANTYLCLHSNQ